MTGDKTRSKTGSETGRDEFMLGFRVPTTCGKKTSITTYSGEVSPPPANRTTTQCETGGKTGSKTGGETGSETGGETGSETGGETGSETGSETSHLVKLSLPDILAFDRLKFGNVTLNVTRAAKLLYWPKDWQTNVLCVKQISSTFRGWQLDGF